jgi:hypothetical protein
MTRSRSIRLTLSVAIASVLSASTFAADAPQGGERHGPSPAAIAACSGKTEGAKVTWTGRSGQQREGECRKDREGALVARGEHGEHHGGSHGPAGGASRPA